MIRVERAAPPPDFDETIARPGQVVLWELEGDPRAPRRPGPPRQHLAPLWVEALPYMRQVFQRRCAYLALHIPRGTGRDTVDHFLPTAEHRHLAYDWGNFRYACLDANRLKGRLQVLDPFHVEGAWFGLDLLDTFQVTPRVAIPGPDEVLWTNTLRVLNDPLFCDARKWYHERYFGRKLDDSDPDEPMPLSVLEHEAPFVARELRRLGMLRPGDV